LGNVRRRCIQLKPQGNHDLVQALHSSGMSRSIFMFVALAAATVAAASDLATGAEGAEDYWAGAVWQDLQLLFSFALGILFVRLPKPSWTSPGPVEEIKDSRIAVYTLGWRTSGNESSNSRFGCSKGVRGHDVHKLGFVTTLWSTLNNMLPLGSLVAWCGAAAPKQEFLRSALVAGACGDDLSSTTVLAAKLDVVKRRQINQKESIEQVLFAEIVKRFSPQVHWVLRFADHQEISRFCVERAMDRSSTKLRSSVSQRIDIKTGAVQIEIAEVTRQVCHSSAHKIVSVVLAAVADAPPKHNEPHHERRGLINRLSKPDSDVKVCYLRVRVRMTPRLLTVAVCGKRCHQPFKKDLQISNPLWPGVRECMIKIRVCIGCCGRCGQLKPSGDHDLFQALPSFGMSRSIFMFVALAATVAAASDVATGAEGAEDYWAGAVWQDLQLIFSFVLGILFVRSAETILDESGASGRNQGLTKLELYPLLS
ncbi:unnamed protein product, partial [Symbiodinium pilosum]